jgi:hypothetical protein
MLATLSIAFTDRAESRKVLPPAEQQQVADALEDDAEVMSNTQLEQLLADQPPAIRDEIVRINTDTRPLALQVALLIPILAGLIGLLNSFRMARLPDPKPSGAVEGMALAESLAYASAFAFSASNSCCVIVPSSSSALAFVNSLAEPPLEAATDWT